jgi:hypothetical protein
MHHILPKAIASTVNCAVIFAASLPIYTLAGLTWWRVSSVVLFFLYNILLSRRCWGMMVARTHLNLPASLTYCALYTGSFTTLLFWIWVPFDLAFANGVFLQLPCLLIKKNTLHGYLAGRRTMTENEIIRGFA